MNWLSLSEAPLSTINTNCFGSFDTVLRNTLLKAQNKITYTATENIKMEKIHETMQGFQTETGDKTLWITISIKANVKCLDIFLFFMNMHLVPLSSFSPTRCVTSSTGKDIVCRQ